MTNKAKACRFVTQRSMMCAPLCDVNAFLSEENALFVYFAIIGAAVGAYAERFIAALIGLCLKARLTQTAFWCGARWVQRKSAHAPCVW